MLPLTKFRYWQLFKTTNYRKTSNSGLPIFKTHVRGIKVKNFGVEKQCLWATIRDFTVFYIIKTAPIPAFRQPLTQTYPPISRLQQPYVAHRRNGRLCSRQVWNSKCRRRLVPPCLRVRSILHRWVQGHRRLHQILSSLQIQPGHHPVHNDAKMSVYHIGYLATIDRNDRRPAVATVRKLGIGTIRG